MARHVIRQGGNPSKLPPPEEGEEVVRNPKLPPPRADDEPEPDEVSVISLEAS